MSPIARFLIPLSLILLLSGCNSRGSLRPGRVDDDAPKVFSVTQSGLMYRVRRKSAKTRPTPNDIVTVHYRGTLENGDVFDSSYARRKPSSFQMGQVVPGWTEGLQMIGEGGMIELIIPPHLAYGEDGVPGKIPPKSNLRFLVELVKVH